MSKILFDSIYKSRARQIGIALKFISILIFSGIILFAMYNVFSYIAPEMLQSYLIFVTFLISTAILYSVSETLLSIRQYVVSFVTFGFMLLFALITIFEGFFIGYGLLLKFAPTYQFVFWICFVSIVFAFIGSLIADISTALQIAKTAAKIAILKKASESICPECHSSNVEPIEITNLGPKVKCLSCGEEFYSEEGD